MLISNRRRFNNNTFTTYFIVLKIRTMHLVQYNMLMSTTILIQSKLVQISEMDMSWILFAKSEGILMFLGIDQHSCALYKLVWMNIVSSKNCRSKVLIELKVRTTHPDTSWHSFSYSLLLYAIQWLLLPFAGNLLHV